MQNQSPNDKSQLSNEISDEINLAEGISASQFTGAVDWFQVQKAGISFGLARATQGEAFVDSKFYVHWKEMQAAGVIRCAYHVFEPHVDVEKQVDHYVNVVQYLEPGDLPPMLDVEIQSERKMDGMEILTGIHEWLSRIEARLSRRPVLYTRPSFWNNNILRGLKNIPGWLSSYDLWLALFTNSIKPSNLPSGWKEWTFWHYTDKKMIEGVQGPIDLHRFNGPRESLAAYTARSALLDPTLYSSDGRGQLEKLVELFHLTPIDIKHLNERLMSDSIDILSPFRHEISQSMERAEESAAAGDWREAAGWLAPAASLWNRWLNDEMAWREVLSRIDENSPASELLNDFSEEMTPQIFKEKLNELEASNSTVSSKVIESNLANQTVKNSFEEPQQIPLKTERTKAKKLTPKPAVEILDAQDAASLSVEPEITGPRRTAAQPAPSQLTPAEPIIIFQTPQPPPQENRISIDIRRDKVTLTIGNRSDQRFVSRNLLAELKNLKQLEASSSAEEFGEYLFRSIINNNPPTAAYQYQTTQDGFNKAVTELGQFSIELIVDENLSGYQWELLKRPGDLPLAIIESRPLFRTYGPARGADKNLPAVHPLKILIAICNPLTLRRDYLPEGRTGRNKNLVGLEVIDVIGHRNAIENSLKILNSKKMLDYEIMVGSSASPVTIDAVKEKIQEGNFHVLHLVAHGITQKGSDEYCVVMENDKQEHAFVFAEEFKAYLAGRKLRLVVFANCQSGNMNLKNPLVLSLVEDVAPAVIAMQRDVPLPTVQLFAQRFYGDLASSGRIDMAMASTRQDLYSASKNLGEWAIPSLLVRPGCTTLFDVKTEGATTVDRPDLDELKKSVKNYQQLGGMGDPSRRKLEATIENQAELNGIPFDSHILNAIRGFLSSERNYPPSSETKMPRQDRMLLSGLHRTNRINWLMLRDYIKAEGGGRLELPDATVSQLATALNSGKHVILNGPPGTGKTSLAEAICRFSELDDLKLCIGHVLTTASADWTTFDTVGGYMPDRTGTLQFRTGVFLDAINAGKWLIIDEINRADIDKSFGELFTVLSGQAVTLPYEVEGQNIRIIPSTWNQGKPIASPLDWIPNGADQPYDFVIHPNWRIIGTMNNYDKSSLFQLSFAFMRRFAFIDVDLPTINQFQTLIYRWLDEVDGLEPMTAGKQATIDLLNTLLVQDEKNALMKYRAIGPAILRDLIKYLNNRDPLRNEPVATFTEAFLLYVAPQLDGLNSDAILEITTYLKDVLFIAADTSSIKLIMKRIQTLYPHISFL